MEVVENEQGRFETGGGDQANVWVSEQVDQRFDVVAAQHGAKEFGGFFAGDEGAGLTSGGQVGKEFGLDLGGIVHAGRNTLAQQLHQPLALLGSGSL